MTLAEALQNVRLETGRTYRCRVRGHLVELRVLEPQPELAAADEPDVMLDAWVALPHPQSVGFGESKLGNLQPPSPPEIPPEDC